MKIPQKYMYIGLLVLLALGAIYFYNNYNIKPTASLENFSAPWAMKWSGVRVVYKIPVDELNSGTGLTFELDLPKPIITWLENYVKENNITKNIEETLVPQVYYYSNYSGKQELVKEGIYHVFYYNNVSIPDKLIVSNVNLEGGDNYKSYSHYLIVYYPLLWFDNFEKYPVGKVNNSFGTWKVEGDLDITYSGNDKGIITPDVFTSGCTYMYKILNIPLNTSWSSLYLLSEAHPTYNTLSIHTILYTIWFKTNDGKIVGIGYRYYGSYYGNPNLDNNNFNKLGEECYIFSKCANNVVINNNVLYDITSQCGYSINDLKELYGISITMCYTYVSYNGGHFGVFVPYVGLTVGTT